MDNVVIHVTPGDLLALGIALILGILFMSSVIWSAWQQNGDD